MSEMCVCVSVCVGVYVQMIYLFILKQLCILETKGCAMYRRALQLLEVSVVTQCVIDGFYHATLC